MSIRYKPRQETKQVILHDSHTVPGDTAWRDKAEQNSLRLGLLSAGYHFIIERDGTVEPCRDRELIGSHTPGHNLDSIAICLVGGREEEGGPGVDNFTKAQRLALLSTLHELCQQYPGVTIKGHSEVQRFRRRDHPPCPAIDMDLLREDLALYAQGYFL